MRHPEATTSRVDKINACLQAQLQRQGLDEVAAVDAARWLDAAAVLKDSDSRPGLPLRNLLRAGRIQGATQRPATPHGRWYIERVDEPTGGGEAELPPAKGPRGQRKTPANMGNADAETKARRRRERAAKKYRPASVKLLLAEAPPAALDRYFYFEDVPTHDSLFRYVARAILEVEPTRRGKAELLARLRDRSVFLIDLKRDPVNGRTHATDVRELVRRVRRLRPEKIIVIKSSVFDLVRETFLDAGTATRR